MVILKVVKGDLLDAPESVIVQQCNCVTKKSLGLSKSIAEKFPFANHYATRTVKSDTPGNINFYKGTSKEWTFESLADYAAENNIDVPERLTKEGNWENSSDFQR